SPVRGDYWGMVRIEQAKNIFQVYDGELLLATFRNLKEAEVHVAKSEDNVRRLQQRGHRRNPPLKRSA
ncbi:MAG TPA: hypothetical protein VI958_11795, partial [Acidobacteriota bacterium]